MIGMSYLIFERSITDLVSNSAWYNNYIQSSSRPRLVYRPETREQIFQNIDNYIELSAKGRKWDQVWSEHVDRKNDFISGLVCID